MKSLQLPSLFRIRRKTLRLLIFILLFANVGLATALSSHAATPRMVRVVIFCANDKCDNSIYTSTVLNRTKVVQSFYKDQLNNGRTFRLDTTVKKIYGSHPASWYPRGTDTSADAPTINTFNNIYYKEANINLSDPDVKTIVVLGFKSLNHCGVGAGGLAIADPSYGCSSYQNSVYAHELGHTFGLDHLTDGTVMSLNACNGNTLGRCKFASSSLSYLRNVTSQTWFPLQSEDPTFRYEPYLDPAPAPAPTGSGIVNFYKYYSESLIDNLYSTDRYDSAKTTDGYSYQGCVAQIYGGQSAGTVPLYRYFNSGNNGAFGGDSYYTTTRNDAGLAAYGYGYVGITGYVFTTQQPGTVALKRYFAGAPKTDHMYTTESFTNGFLDYNYDTVEAYVFPPPADHCGPTDPAPSIQLKTPLYHYVSAAVVDNFYTIYFGELGYGAGGYEYKGCSAFVWDKQVPGSVPLYRYYSSAGTDHFYSITQSDASLAAYGFVPEGIAAWVFPDGSIADTVPFNRYYAGGTAIDHYYTQDAWPNGYLGYYFDNVEGYSYNHNNTACPR
ncbi:MAG: hypothetical protein QFB86_01785 [Patescibacteria group bacterium]|nr:hypothetical protein [Patescibacteria group bacterium]